MKTSLMWFLPEIFLFVYIFYHYCRLRKRTSVQQTIVWFFIYDTIGMKPSFANNELLRCDNRDNSLSE